MSSSDAAPSPYAVPLQELVETVRVPTAEQSAWALAAPGEDALRWGDGASGHDDGD